MSGRNLTIQILSLCLAIVASAVVCPKDSKRSREIVKSEIAMTPTLPIFSSTSSSSEPMAMRKTIVTKLEKHRDSTTSTVFDKMAEKIDEDDAKNKTIVETPRSTIDKSRTMDFRPSTHVGRIDDYESRKSTTNPFNNVQHVKFENSLTVKEAEDDVIGGARIPLSSSSPLSLVRGGGGERANPFAGRTRDSSNIDDTDGRYEVPISIEYHVSPQAAQHDHRHGEDIVANEYDNNDNYDNKNYNNYVPIVVGHEYVGTVEQPISHYTEIVARPMTMREPSYPTIVTDHKPQYANRYEPIVNNPSAIVTKPSKFQGEVVTSIPEFQGQFYQYVAPVGIDEDIVGSEFLQHHPTSYQLAGQPFRGTNVEKPSTTLFLTSHRETAITRMRKFPYKFHYPGAEHHDTEYHYVSEGRHGYPVNERRISPWKKIIHLIGAFLPLGLLLAVLKPNVVRLGGPNSTQPVDVLSTLRDLPVEHKNGRHDIAVDTSRQDSCEDKIICELIVSGSKPHANLLQNILWNFTSESTDDEAKKHGLHEIFLAVRQRNCSSISC